MPVTNTTPTTNASGETSGAWGGRARRPKMLRKRVTVTHGASIVAVGVNLPAKAQAVWAHVRASTAVAVSGAIGGTAPNGIALVFFPTSNAAATAVLTAAPSTASASNPGGTNGYLLGGTPGTGTDETNGVFRGPPVGPMLTNGQPVNRNPVAAFLALVPYHTSSNRIQVNSAATDSGYYFGTTNAANTSADGVYDVVLYYEEFEDYPSF